MSPNQFREEDHYAEIGVKNKRCPRCRYLLPPSSPSRCPNCKTNLSYRKIPKPLLLVSDERGATNTPNLGQTIDGAPISQTPLNT